MSDADQIVIDVIEGWGEAKHGAEKTRMAGNRKQLPKS